MTIKREVEIPDLKSELNQMGDLILSSVKTDTLNDKEICVYLESVEEI